jgi:hypothetical protein
MLWYEAWSDESFDVPYILIMGQLKNGGEIMIFDPKEDNKIVFRSNSYDEAKLWLLEDEYTMVDGRMTE